MDTVICKEVVITTQTRRGKGVPNSPIRVITEVFEKDGAKIAEFDPSPETFTAEDMVKFYEWYHKLYIENTVPQVNHVLEWQNDIKK